ncbi:MAG: GNAT family N-acetyltransferase [Candidatus Thorarchaeota archaeon]
MKIREATRDDSEWILHHRIGMFTDMGESKDFIQESARLTEQYLKNDWNKDYRYFLVELNDEVIGGCGITTFRVPPHASQKRGAFAYLSNMFVERGHRGKGVGRALLKQVIEVCKKEEIGLIFLHASDQGIPLYESEGFSSSERLMSLHTLNV